MVRLPRLKSHTPLNAHPNIKLTPPQPYAASSSLRGSASRQRRTTTSRCAAPTFPRASSAVTSPATRATPSVRVMPPGRSSRPTGARSGYRYSAWPPLSTRVILVSMLRVGGAPSVPRDAPRLQMTASRRRTARWYRTASIRPLRHATVSFALQTTHTLIQLSIPALAFS